MSILEKIKFWFMLRKMRKNNGFAEVLRQYEESVKKALAYTIDELEQLPDQELYEAVRARAEHKAELEDYGVSSLTEAQLVVYITSYYEMEVCNGGLCQFFVNSSRRFAPYLSQCLEVLGAEEHKKLFDDFVCANNIDLNDLSSFDIEKVEEFAEQNERYPFDEFDSAFYDLPSISECSYTYVKEHLEEL